MVKEEHTNNNIYEEQFNNTTLYQPLKNNEDIKKDRGTTEKVKAIMNSNNIKNDNSIYLNLSYEKIWINGLGLLFIIYNKEMMDRFLHHNQKLLHGQVFFN